MSPTPDVLVIDDNDAFVKSLVRAFKLSGVRATGCSHPAQILGWHARDRFDYDLILLDMRLGESPDGGPLSALNILPHLMTYAPSSKVVVFTQEDMTVDEALKCIERGALTVVPKGSHFGELCRVAEVYQRLGDRRQTREELIDVLWDDLRHQRDGRKGQRLEMLVMNLFESMPTFRVIANNVKTKAGSIDVLVENQNRHRFWNELSSVHLAVECKNKKRPPEPKDFNHFKEVVKSRRFCQAGIIVSMSPFTETFRSRQGEVRELDGVHIFGLGADHLERLVETPFDRREAYLRGVLEPQ